MGAVYDLTVEEHHNYVVTGQNLIVHNSGKTYNGCIAWASYLSKLEEPETLSLVRATGPALKASIVKDMIAVLREMGLYSSKRHHKTDMTIELPNGSVIDYFPTDDEMKVHGRTRDHLWANESNEIPFAAWRQLMLRTKGRKMLDFNPSFEPRHWIMREYEGSRDSIWYTSTYKDNPYITDEQRRQIEALKESDPWAWKVYGLGLYARPATAIYHNVTRLSEWNHSASSTVLGLDFGYNDPMSLCRIKRTDQEGVPLLDVWHLIHESYLTTSQLVERFPDVGVTKRDLIICDNDPDRIQQIKKKGYNAMPVTKGAGSVKAGIDYLKGHAIRIGGPAQERAYEEVVNYRWKRHVTSGVVLDEPVGTDDHAPDAIRYPAMEYYMRSVPFAMW